MHSRSSGLSQQKLADRTGFQVRYLSQLENHPQDISTRTLERLAKGLGISPLELIGDIEPHAVPQQLPRKMTSGLDEAIRILKVHRSNVR